MKRLHEYQIEELYNRMVRLWGNLEINDFYNILDQEGYYDLKTRIKITEKMYEGLKRSYGLNWRKVLGSMINGTDPNLNKRIQNHRNTKKKYEQIMGKNWMDLHLKKYTILWRESQGYSLLFLDKKKRDRQGVLCLSVS